MVPNCVLLIKITVCMNHNQDHVKNNALTSSICFDWIFMEYTYKTFLRHLN